MVPCRVLVVPPCPHLAVVCPPGYAPEILVRVITVVSKVPTVTGMGPNPRSSYIFVSVVAFAAKFVATLTWMGYGFGLRRAQ